MSSYEPPRWHSGRYLLVTAILVGVSYWALLPPSTHELTRLALAHSDSVAETIVHAITADSATGAAAATNVELDYFLILSYVAFLGFLGAAVASLKGLRDVTWVRRTLLAVVFLQGVAGVLDGVENVGLLAMLKSDSMPPHVATRIFWVSTAKWCLIALGLAAPVLAFLFARRQGASSTASQGAAGV